MKYLLVLILIGAVCAAIDEDPYHHIMDLRPDYLKNKDLPSTTKVIIDDGSFSDTTTTSNSHET